MREHNPDEIGSKTEIIGTDRLLLYFFVYSIIETRLSLLLLDAVSEQYLVSIFCCY
jgi:hypothetical protein